MLIAAPLKFWLLFLVDLAIGIVFLTYLVRTFALTPDKKLLIFWASFGALLPDILRVFFKDIVLKTRFGQAYLAFHKNFHFRFKTIPKFSQILSVMLIEILFIGFSLLLIWGMI